MILAIIIIKIKVIKLCCLQPLQFAGYCILPSDYQRYIGFKFSRNQSNFFMHQEKAGVVVYLT